MLLNDIKQPPFNASLMGVVQCGIGHYGLGHSPAMAYGGSGHAFLINVHQQVCPSGPYCWKPHGFIRLLRNLGLEMEDLGILSTESGPGERASLEKAVRERLDRGQPCSVNNMDNQIILGHDDKGFLLAQPWPGQETTPVRLTYGTWEEFGSELHAGFFAFGRLEPAPLARVVRDGLENAVDMFENPEEYVFPKYDVGLGAYDNWIRALESGRANPHGHWWNAVVWAECRAMASAWFSELAEVHKLGDRSRASKLAECYKEIAAKLEGASDREKDAEEKAGLLKELRDLEGDVIGMVGGYIKSVR